MRLGLGHTPPPLLERAAEAPTDEAFSAALKAAEVEASREANSANANEISELLITAEPAFKTLAHLRKQLNELAAKCEAA